MCLLRATTSLFSVERSIYCLCSGVGKWSKIKVACFPPLFFGRQVESLRSMLQASRDKNGVYIEPWRFDQMENTIASQGNQVSLPSPCLPPTRLPLRTPLASPTLSRDSDNTAKRPCFRRPFCKERSTVLVCFLFSAYRQHQQRPRVHTRVLKGAAGAGAGVDFFLVVWSMSRASGQHIFLRGGACENGWID